MGWLIDSSTTKNGTCNSSDEKYFYLISHSTFSISDMPTKSSALSVLTIVKLLISQLMDTSDNWVPVSHSKNI